MFSLYSRVEASVSSQNRSMHLEDERATENLTRNLSEAVKNTDGIAVLTDCIGVWVPSSFRRKEPPSLLYWDDDEVTFSS